MKKVLTIFTFFFLLPISTYAISGACSYHNGVNCGAGASYTGKVQCNDGWINSSVYFYETSECKTTQLSRCVYPSSWSSCKTEADYSLLESKISLSQIRTGTSFNSENNAQALKECRDSITSYATIISTYNQCMITEYSYNPETSKVLEVKPSNVNTELIEKQKKEEIDKIFQKYFTLAMDTMPEYKNIVDPLVIKELSLKSENGNKTFQQLITETYASKLPVKTLETIVSTSTATTSISFSFQRNLKKGMRGEDVKQLQTLLKNLGYLPTSHISSVNFGVITNSAVIKFQKDNKIQPATGFIGPTTQAKIISLSKTQ
jgi:hypothetical protein